MNFLNYFKELFKNDDSKFTESINVESSESINVESSESINVESSESINVESINVEHSEPINVEPIVEEELSNDSNTKKPKVTKSKKKTENKLDKGVKKSPSKRQVDKKSKKSE